MWHPRKSSGTRGTGGESGAAETVTPPVGRGSSPRAIIHYPGYVAENLKKQLSVLSKRGPHRVLVGDLDFAGLPGKVYTPAEGSGIPGVAFGHDWMLGLKRYHATLRHLASWGIAVAAPSTETGFTPNHRGFAADLQTALQVLAGVKLGSGNVTVSPKKLGLAGHGMGGGAAILAALDNPQAKAVATIFPAVTSPSNYEAAKHMTVPGLVIDSETNGLMDAGNPATVAFNWGADVAYRQISNGNQLGFAEGALLHLFVGLGLPQTSAQENIRGLVTGFLLHQLGGEKKYSAFSAFEAEAKNVGYLTREELADRADIERVDASSIFKRS